MAFHRLLSRVVSNLVTYLWCLLTSNSRYFIPEDGDDESCPNVFLAPKPRQPGTPPTLGQVKDAFPLPGRYHFRFKSPLFPGGDREKGAMAVWMDTVQDGTPVPVWKNSIIAKVTRIAAEDDEEDDDDDDFVGGRGVSTSGSSRPAPAPVSAPAPPPRAPPSHQSSIHSSTSADHLDIFDSAPASTSAPQPVSHSAPHGTGNLLDGHGPTMGAPAAASGASDLLGMGGGYGHPQPAATSAHNDFLGMTAPPPQTPVAPTPSRPAAHPGSGYPGSTPAHNPYGATPQTSSLPPPGGSGIQQAQQNAFDSFSNQQGPFGGLGTPWKP